MVALVQMSWCTHIHWNTRAVGRGKGALQKPGLIRAIDAVRGLSEAGQLQGRGQQMAQAARDPIFAMDIVLPP